MIPTSLSDVGLRLLQDVCLLFGATLVGRKTDLGRHVVFSGLIGLFPGPGADMILSVTLSGDKKAGRIAIIRKVLVAGRIPHKDLESLTGEISLSQKSILGLFIRITSRPLYRKLHAAYYRSILTDRGRITPSRRVGVLSKQHQRAASRHKPFPDFIIYSDAATSAMIMAIVALFRSDFIISHRIAHCCGIRASGAWARLFPETSLIYGLGHTALVLTVAGPRIPLNNIRITCYVDNNNTLAALIKADCFWDFTAVLTRIFRAICAARCITPWLERVGSDVNISGIPARGDELPFGAGSVADLSSGAQLLEMAMEGIRGQTDGYFGPELLVGMLYSHFYARTGEGRPRCSYSGHTSGGSIFRIWSNRTWFLGWKLHPHQARTAISPHGFSSGLLRGRNSAHSHPGLLLAIPPHRQINAETATQFSGLVGLIVTASIIISLTGRARADFIPSPDYFPPRCFIALSGEESLPVEILSSLCGGGV